METEWAAAIASTVAASTLGATWLYRRFLRREEEPSVVERAYAAYDDGRRRRAARLVERALRKTPGSEAAIYLRVLIRLETEEPSSVADEVLPAVPNMKRPGGTALLLAQAFLRRGNERSARYWYDVARTDPTFEMHLEAMPLRDQMAMRLGGQERSYQ